MKTVYLTMRTAEGKEVNREIDGSNILVSVGETSQYATSPELQRELLNEWIEDRGNDQHATELTLVSWFVK